MTYGYPDEEPYGQPPESSYQTLQERSQALALKLEAIEKSKEWAHLHHEAAIRDLPYRGEHWAPELAALREILPRPPEPEPEPVPEPEPPPPGAVEPDEQLEPATAEIPVETEFDPLLPVEPIVEEDEPEAEASDGQPATDEPPEGGSA
jgi:hypothetical protein